nr:hypothetical protein [Tanacetum cinerariifolium]
MPSRAKSELLYGGRHIDLFILISAPNPTKVKTRTRPHTTYEVPLLTATTSRVIDMEDTVVALGSSGTPPVLEKLPLDFADEDPPQIITVRRGAKDQVHDGLRRKKGNDKAKANASPKVLRKDHAAFRPAQSTLRKKSLASLGLDAGSTFATSVTQDAPTAAKSVSDPDLLSYVKPQLHPELDIS